LLNPLAVEVMREVYLDISTKQTKGVLDFYERGGIFHYVITVCDEANAERCPIFPGITKRLHWSFTDPASLPGNWEEKLEATRRIRDDIRQSVSKFIKETAS
jgi:arsenate reductase